MTREEAVYQINQLAVLSTDKEIPKITEALEMAIEALQREDEFLKNLESNKPQFYDEDDYWNGRVPTHGRLIDADALSKKLCATTIFIKDGEAFQHMINDAPTVPVVDITQRDLCEYINCEDCPFMEETCKLMDYVAYADRPHGEWVEVVERTEQYDREGVKTWATLYQCSNCGFVLNAIEGHIGQYDFCPNCGADMRGGDTE